jgi:predicted AlkP superfamily phosphohydrolase/phosphomutase
MSKRVIIVGLDGTPYELIKGLSEKGVMPNTKQIISKGTFKRMESSIPEVSCVAWSSIITGRNPGQHGIFGFTDLYPYSYQLRFPNFGDLKQEPFWIDKESIIINVPSTYPVREMRGVHISGFVSIDLEKSVYPKSLIPKLKELDYRLDVDSEIAHQSMDLFLSDLNRTLEARIKTSQYLWQKPNWQIFMLVFTGMDRLMHFLWDAYLDQNHKYHRDFLEHFRKIDEVIGEITKKINDEDLLIILSDHGFEKVDREIYINCLLEEEGFLRFKDKPELGNIDSSTKAFALDPGRIYINLKGKYPYGEIDNQDRERVLEDLEALFATLQIDNKRVIRDVYRKEEIYSGPYLDKAPDLILVGGQGFNLRGKVNAGRLFDKAIFTGKHTQHNAFIITDRDLAEDTSLDKLKVFDIADIIKRELLTNFNNILK